MKTTAKKQNHRNKSRSGPFLQGKGKSAQSEETPFISQKHTEGIQPKLATPPPGGKYEQKVSTLNQNDVSKAENYAGLPDPLKTNLEALSGMDLSGVRVNYNSTKPAQLNALAFTQGQDIHVGPGQEKHLPHEGWHAVQQMQGRVKPTMQAKGVSINNDETLEREADVMGEEALQATRRTQQNVQWLTTTAHTEEMLQCRHNPTNPAPKRSKPDTVLLSRVRLYRIFVYGSEYWVILDRQKNPWHEKYTAEALSEAAFVALVSHVYQRVPQPIAVLEELKQMIGKRIYAPSFNHSGLESSPAIDQYFITRVTPGALEIIGTSMPLNINVIGKRLRHQTRLGVFLDAAFVDVTRRWASIQPALPAERLRQSGLSSRNVFTILTDEMLRNALSELAKRHKATEALVKVFNADEALAIGKREPRASDFEILTDAEWTDALVALAVMLKEKVGQAAIDRRERTRKHQLNKYLSPKAVEVEEVAPFVLKTYDLSSTVTVDFLGPMQLKRGQKIVNARGETLFLLSVTSLWIVYQNEADKRFYRQRVKGVQEELRYGVYALAAEKTEYIIPMTQFIFRVAGALFPAAGYVYTASNILHVMGQTSLHWDEIKVLYANILISRKNIEQVIPGLFEAAVTAGVSASASKLFDPNQPGLALDEWIIAALKIARRVASKKAAGGYATEAAIGALAKIWKAIKTVLGKLVDVLWYVATIGRPVVVGGAGPREGGTSSSSLAEVTNKLAAIGVANASGYAKQLVHGQTSDEVQLLIDEVEELGRNGEKLIQLLLKVTSW